MQHLVLLLVLAQLIPASTSAVDVIASHRAAQEVAKKRFVFSHDLLCATPRVHGLLNKKAGQYSCDETSEESFALYERAGVPVSARLMAFISDEHRFIYIRQPKCSSSAVLAQMAHLFCNADKYDNCNPHLLRPSRWVRIADDLWRTYFVFTFVRNPLTRLASAYSYFHKLFMRTKLPNDGLGPPCVTPFGAFASDPSVLTRACEERRCCVYFDWLKAWSQNFTNNYFLREHFSDMSHFVYSGSGKPMVDFLGRTEHVNDDWADILRLLGQRNGRVYAVNTVEAVNRHFSGKPADKGCAPPLYLAMYNEEAMRNVVMNYARDFVQLGYL